MIDVGFPIIRYDKKKSSLANGQEHGEEFANAIKELVEIRRDLMLQRSPELEPKLETISLQQWSVSQAFDPELALELRGISEGANISINDVVILNNYTDFRDISLPDEGCSTAHVNDKNNIWAGQTWDMHRSAKNYACVIDVPERGDDPKNPKAPRALMFSLVGCVGMMGVNFNKCLVGVNNINTKNARAGLIWPLLVRNLLKKKNRKDIVASLTSAPVTSGHNYVVADPSGGEQWEVTPTVKALVSKVELPNPGYTFHTNHCLTEEAKAEEDVAFQNSTSKQRYDLIEKKIKGVQSYDGLLSLLTDHEGYPKSICSHFESGAQDPSYTCGGGIAYLSGDDIIFWRGCKKYDDNYVEHKFKYE